MKQCFECERIYPLFLFRKNPRKYQRPEHKGRNLVCKFCTYKRWKTDMYAWIINTESKFVKIEFKNKCEIIKRLLTVLNN